MSREPARSDPQRRRIQTDLVNVLERMHLMRVESSRQLLLDELSDRIGQVPVRSHGVLRLQVAEIVRACVAREDAVAELVTVVEHLDPAAPELKQLLRLRDEWEAVDLLSSEDWNALRPALETSTPPNLAYLCQQATAHQLVGPPGWCTNAWHVFVHLAGFNAGADGVPPHMMFLALLESEVDPDVARLIRRRNQEQASRYDLTGALDSRRAAIDSGGDIPRKSTAYLVIQIEPDLDPTGREAGDEERYQLSYLRQWRGPDAWHSRQGVSRTVRFSELEREVERVVDQMEGEWSDWPGAVTVEFVLPWSLLNSEVEWWRRESDSSRPTALAMDYPIVIRSLDRLYTQRWHRRWHERWQQLQTAPASSTVEVSRPSGEDYFTRLESNLKSDDQIVSLVLSEPPVEESGAGRQEVEAAMRAGLPVVIWHRTDCDSPAFREVIERVTADGGLTQLPERVKELRLEALRLEPDARHGHVGRQLTVLWDDPERKPDPLGAPLAPGGGYQ